MTRGSKVGRHGKPLAKGSVAQAYRTLNRVLEATVADELLGRNPLSGIEPPPPDTDLMRFLSHVGALATAKGPRSRPLVLVAAYTGLRAGEALRCSGGPGSICSIARSRSLSRSSRWRAGTS